MDHQLGCLEQFRQGQFVARGHIFQPGHHTFRWVLRCRRRFEVPRSLTLFYDYQVRKGAANVNADLEHVKYPLSGAPWKAVGYSVLVGRDETALY